MEGGPSRINLWSIPCSICRVNYILTERRRRSYREYLTSNRNKVQTEGIDTYIALRRQAPRLLARRQYYGFRNTRKYLSISPFALINKEMTSYLIHFLLSILFSGIIRNMNSLQNSLCKIIEITENSTCKINSRQKKFMKSSETETKAWEINEELSCNLFTCIFLQFFNLMSSIFCVI